MTSPPPEGGGFQRSRAGFPASPPTARVREYSVEVLHRLHRLSPPARRRECCAPRSRRGHGRAAVARPLADVQRHLRPARAAGRAQLGEGNQRSTTIEFAPVPGALVLQHGPQLAPRRVGDGAGELWFLTMLRTVRSSITTVWFSRTRRVVSLCRWSRRRSAIRAWTVATFAGPWPGSPSPSPCGTAPLRLGQPGTVAALVPGVGDLLPGGQGHQEVIPASTPTAAVGGRGADGVLAQQGHEPAPRRVLRHRHREGSAPSGSGRDHTMSSGSLIFASVSAPSRKRNADRVYSADSARLLPRLEARVLGPLAEEVGERRLQVPQPLLERHRGHLVQEGQFLGLLPRRQHRRRLRVVDPLLPRTTPRSAPRAPCCRPSGRTRTCATAPPPAVGRVEAVLERPLHQPSPMSHIIASYRVRFGPTPYGQRTPGISRLEP